MPNTPTPNVGLNKPAQGDTPWDGTINGNFDRLDSIFGGTFTVPAIRATVLQGSSLVSPNNGNNVGLLNVQGPAAAVVGTGAPIALYNYTLPGNTLRVGTGIRISLALQHSTGTASVTYTITYGGQTVITSANAATGQGTTVIAFFNIGATNTQKGGVLSSFGVFSNNATNTSTTVDSTVNQVITANFTAAATEQVTPGLFIVELVQ